MPPWDSQMGRRLSTHANTLLDQKLAIVSVTRSPVSTWTMSHWSASFRLRVSKPSRC
ncbi:hypothetical protein MXAN_7235 [Myxococcus xanthus DK 1622]|uniref:Uncharacterized protein n=1 Tax=Myxococcus xanthus (strain DK1622) TaxID=246197 RepID=Q1CW75_MYXXD|nr:hypothetical protein MXAN_7235 [Myxococcus xanthus DK 1622]